MSIRGIGLVQLRTAVFGSPYECGIQYTGFISHSYIFVIRPLGPMVTSLLADHEVQGLIIDCVSAEELFHDMCGIAVSAFVFFIHLLSCVVFRGDSVLC